MLEEENMASPPTDVDVTTVHVDDIDDAFDGLPDDRGGDETTTYDIDDFSVLTGDDATKFREVALQHEEFESLKRYCESRYDATIDVDDPAVLEHPHLTAPHSVIFTSEPRPDKNDSWSVDIQVFVSDGSVSQVVAFHEHKKREDLMEVRVIHLSDGGVTERVADQELRYELRGVRYHRSEREPHHRHLGRYRLSSGAAWGRPFWVLSGSAVEHRYDEPGRGDFRRRDGDATLGYQLGESLRVSVTGGAGQYRVGDGPDRDTRRWSANTDWSPGRFGAGASWGESRLELADGEERTREQRSLALRYSSGRSEYRVSYTEEITDFGIDPELAELERFLNDLRELAGVDGVLDLDLDSRVAFTESWRAVWRYSVPEGSTWRLGLRQQEIDRDFVLAGTGEGQVDRERSVDGSWTRPLASRTDAGLNGSLGRRESLEGVGRERDYWRIGARIGHDISPRTRASLGYQHRQDRVEQPGGSAERFRENRLTALVRITF